MAIYDCPLSLLLNGPGPFDGRKTCNSRIIQRVIFKVATETSSSRVWLLLGTVRGDATVGDGESGEDQV